MHDQVNRTAAANGFRPIEEFRAGDGEYALMGMSLGRILFVGSGVSI